MNLIIFGNGERSIEVYRNLNIKNHNINGFITVEKNYSFLQQFIPKKLLISLEDINNEEAINNFLKLKPDLFIVAGFSQIFTKELLSIPKIGTINLHAGKLPKYRGGSPLNWQLINREEKAGISIILMDEGIDTGNILAEDIFEIEKEDDINSLHNKANKKFPKLVIEAIKELEKGNKGIKQDESQAIYWHQRQEKDGEINFKILNALDVQYKIKALSPPYNGAWANLDGKKIIFTKSEIPKLKIKGTPGKVLFINKIGPYIICKDYAILIIRYNSKDIPYFKLRNNMYF